MTLTDEFYSGRRPQHWDEITSVQLTIPTPKVVTMTNDNAPFEHFSSAMTVDSVVAKLKTGVVTVQFRDVHGVLNEMKCTLNEDLIPESKRPKIRPTAIQDVVRTPNLPPVSTDTGTYQKNDPNLIKVYALDRDGWRSFRFERLISII